MRFRNVAVILALLAISAVPAAQALTGDPVARDIAAEIGLNFHGNPVAATQGETPVFDYDGGGVRDILLSTHGGSPWPLLQSQPDGTFREVLAGTFHKTDRHGCVVADFGSLVDGGLPDGLPDVYCVTGACNGTCKKEYPNSLFIQRADRTFTDVARSWGVADVRGRGREPAVLDFDRDGLPDLVVANEGPSIYPPENRLFRNLGGRFEEITDSVVRSVLHSIAVATGDIDGDGWADIVLRRKVDTTLRIVTYRNAAGIFTDISATTAYKKRVAEEIDLADVNGDGRPDLLIVELKRFSVWLNVGGTFPKAHFTFALQQGRDLAVGDVNLDGKPDMYIVQGSNPSVQDVMLLNNGNGKSYRTLEIPQATTGDGDVATAIPNWNGTGRAAFLVTNGRWGKLGPVQLITFSAE
ncbi:MAG: VCBS repeat-containing protein [Geminicoccaceae bacterium]